MASVLPSTALSSASLAFSLPTRPATHLAAFSKPRPFSIPADLSFPPPASPLSPPPRRPPPPLFARKWALPAATEEATETQEEPAEVPEPVEVQLAASTATETDEGERVFAVVMIGSRQYIVFPGRYLYTQRLKGSNVNDKIILNKVLLVGSRTKTYIGQPVVTNAAVHAVVEEQGLNRKVTVFKYKRKKNYRRNIGHRQPNTRIRITGITGYQDFPFETLPEAVPAGK